MTRLNIISYSKVFKVQEVSKDADFNFDYINFPNYVNQSEYSYPNNNLAIFGENIFY